MVNTAYENIWNKMLWRKPYLKKEVSHKQYSVICITQPIQMGQLSYGGYNGKGV
jgi:hypothetical protein